MYRYRRLGPVARGWSLAALCAALALLCGGARAADRTPFDHLTTGFELLGQHRDLPCESCHVNAIFKGTPRDCAACHGVGTTVRATAKPVSHILTSDRCEACHTPVAWNPAVNFDHAEVRGSCSSCHNGVQAQGKGPTHIDTTLECNLCHTTIGWAGAVFNHNNVTTGCSSCHNGIRATGPPATHIPTGAAANAADPANAPCEACHTPTNYVTWSGTAMNHPAVTPPMLCANCHEAGKSFFGVTIVTRPATVKGVTHPATGDCGLCHTSTVSFSLGNLMPVGHIPTSQPCTLCHANLSDFTQKVMDHSGITTGCAACHASGLSFYNMAPLVLKEPAANHISFGGAGCESCHSNTTFTAPPGFTFTNASGTAPPAMVHTAVASLSCASCHSLNQTDSGTPPTKTLPANHVPFGSASCNACHGGAPFSTFTFANVSGTAAPAMVHSAVSAIACSTCHESTVTLWVGTPTTVLRPLTEPHSGNVPHPVSGECSDCHKSTVTFIGATNFPANHIPVPAADGTNCALCHTTAGNYSVAVMDHANITSNCAQCHAAGLSFANIVPKHPAANHINFGSAACESCHSNSNFTTPGGFSFTNASGTAPPAMVHTAVASLSCASCHSLNQTDSGTPPTKTLPAAGHVPTGAASCGACHVTTAFMFTNASGTAPPAMVHSAVSGTPCSTCHEAGKSWLGTPATKVRPLLKADGTAHVAAGECSTCHTNTTSFKGATDLPVNHIPIPAADVGGCVLCHTTVGNYSLAVMNHVNITSNCMQCHAYGLSFANMAPPALVQPPSGPQGHIPSNPPNGTQNYACELCHLPTVFTSFAGTIMKHATVRAMTCMSCHEIGMKWKTNTGARLWVRDSANHYKGQDCGNSGCHSTRDKFAARRSVALSAAQRAGATATPSLGGTATALGHAIGFDHRRVAGTACVSCHGPGSGIGKPASHIATTDSCESCHTTLAWLPVTRVDHLQVRGACATCHNGTVASGKGSNHIASGNDCETCHTSNAWTPARFDHAGVAPHSCRTCHDSLHASGLPVNHVPTTAQCDTCHGTLSWKPAKLDHTTLTASCASCHNNSTALGVPPTHMVMTRDCATCHSYPDWTVLHFVHASAAYPGEHRAALVCTSCHTTNTDQIPWRSAAQAGSCAGCHASDFKPDLHPKSMNGLKYTAGELRDCTGACHVYKDATLGTIAKPMPGPYHRVSDAAFKH
ncbi:MAG TPA: cytochrome c3 family protein [Steroidobacteraceae bacterium]|nr:cytochrome c3 family protein [Steroidobacteraceae bacterium]